MSDEKLNKIMNYLEDLNKRISNIEKSLLSPKIKIQETQESKNIPKKESFREFYLKYGVLKKETDKTLVIIYFLESRGNISNITIKEISQGFKDVREPHPKNISDKMQMLHRSGFIDSNEGPGRLKTWEITGSGLKHLEEIKNE